MTQHDVVQTVTGHRPGKVVALHLTYPSRMAERGRTPANASYFLKPSSSLTGSGQVVRPEGFELLQFEGEVALIIGTKARSVSPEDGWSHVGWVTAANDLGLQDLRYADKGSNVRSKGGDGFTPLGPELIEASKVSPDGLRIRTWLDGELVQEDTSGTMTFTFGEIIADLSRLMTLEVGDVILTGTPAGASVALPGQTLQVEVSSVSDESITTGRLTTEVVEGPAVGPYGSPPKADAEATEDAWGSRAPQGDGSDDAGADALATQNALAERLKGVAVATLSVQMRKRGFDTVSIDGVTSLVPGTKFAGPARTLRYVAYRKDLFAARGGGYNSQKQAIDSVNPGEVLVMEARGVDDAGTLGDILAKRAQVRGAAAIITDGCVRDRAPVVDTGLPVMAGGANPAVLGRRHVPWAVDETIVCGGATVQVGDWIVADDDGAVVIPPNLVEEVVTDAETQEAEEEFIFAMVEEGNSVDGLYPMNAEWKAKYEQWRAAR